MKKISKEDIKNFWEKNRNKILAGGGIVGGAVVTGLAVWNAKKTLNELKSDDWLKNSFEEVMENFGRNPSRPIPETELFKILDIGDDVDDGCVVWLDGCKLSDCGKLGEGLTKIDRVDPEMLATMIILAKDKLEL